MVQRWFVRCVELSGFLVSGVGLGWLLGLSMSPVLHVVLSSLLAVVSGLLASWYAVASEAGDSTRALWSSRPRLTAVWAVTMLLLGAALGAPAGLYARENALFGPNPERLYRVWEHFGADKRSLYRDVLASPSEAVPKRPLAAGLYAAEGAAFCDDLLSLAGDVPRLRTRIVQSSSPAFRALANIESDPKLGQAVKEVCASTP